MRCVREYWAPWMDAPAPAPGGEVGSITTECQESSHTETTRLSTAH